MAHARVSTSEKSALSIAFPRNHRLYWCRTAEGADNVYTHAVYADAMLLTTDINSNNNTSPRSASTTINAVIQIILGARRPVLCA